MEGSWDESVHGPDTENLGRDGTSGGQVSGCGDPTRLGYRLNGDPLWIVESDALRRLCSAYAGSAP